MPPSWVLPHRSAAQGLHCARRRGRNMRYCDNFLPYKGSIPRQPRPARPEQLLTRQPLRQRLQRPPSPPRLRVQHHVHFHSALGRRAGWPGASCALRKTPCYMQLCTPYGPFHRYLSKTPTPEPDYLHRNGPDPPSHSTRPDNTSNGSIQTTAGLPRKSNEPSPTISPEAHR